MENNYRHYSVTDFASDEDFLRHYLSPTADSERRWAQWLSENPQQRESWDNAKLLVAAVLEGLTAYSRNFLTEEAEAALLERIRQTNRVQTEAVPLHSARRRYLALAAATAAIALVAFLFVWKKGPKDASPYDRQTSRSEVLLQEHANFSPADQAFYLPDSSQILLSPGSRISYPVDFGTSHRTVFLSGKAFFDVVKDPAHPFLVYANEIVTRVLGTRFEVKAFDKDADVVVKVSSGKVTVYRNKEKAGDTAVHTESGGVLLLPNQQVIFSRSEKQFSKELVEKPAVLAPSTNSHPFVYEEAAVARVFEEISAAYGVEIVFNEQVLSHCQLSASLTEESLIEKMDIICKSINATYDIVEAKIIVNSQGCTTP